jgi:hypothetical protein
MSHSPASIADRRPLYVVLFFAVIALVFALPVFYHLDNWGILDWDQHLFYHAAPRITLLEYGQFPLWNPYYCGGTVLLANPQSRLLSPSFLFILLFGEVVGIKIEIWLHLVVGLVGTYALARHYQLFSPFAMMASFVFMLSSMYALNLTVGMTWFLSVAYLPWVFLSYLKAFQNWKYALVSGLGLALMFFGGGAYPLPITILFLAVYSLILVSFKEYKLTKVAKLLAVTLVFAFCIGAIKFLPAIEFLQANPRRIYDYSGFSLNSLQFGLLSRDQTLGAIGNLPLEKPGFLDGVTGGMDENGMYIGIIPLGLSLIGIGLHDKRRMLLALCLIIFLWLSFGNRSRPIELWTPLHLLPVYDSMRVAQRFRIVFMLCLSVFAGFGLRTADSYMARLVPRPALTRFFAPAVLLFVLVDLWTVNSPIYKDAFPIPPLETVRNDVFHQVWAMSAYDRASQQSWLPDSALYPALLSNVGVIDCYETANVPRSAVPISSPDYKGEAYLLGTGGTAQISAWSPNRITVDVDTSSAGFLVLNQNYYPGWSLERGGGDQVEDKDGLLAVRVTPSDHRLVLHYLPSSFIAGLAVTLTSILFSIILVASRGRVRFPGG